MSKRLLQARYVQFLTCKFRVTPRGMYWSYRFSGLKAREWGVESDWKQQVAAKFLCQALLQTFKDEATFAVAVLAQEAPSKCNCGERRKEYPDAC